MARTHGDEHGPSGTTSSEALARKTFFVALVGCLLFALASFAFVLR